MTRGKSALRNLSAVDGQFYSNNRIQAITGNFSDTGTVSVSSTSAVASLSISGTLAQQSANGTLTAGTLNVNASSASFASTIKWQGADIHTIGQGASVSLSGGRGLSPEQHRPERPAQSLRR